LSGRYIQAASLGNRIKEVMREKANFPCPACGFIVFDEPPGSYDICPVCNWEDDYVQLTYPAMSGGANKESLYEYQQIWIERLPLSKNSYEEYRRDQAWRPLRLEEIESLREQPETGKEYFEAAGEYWLEYSWRRKEAT
jgi:hypothetical protein